MKLSLKLSLLCWLVLLCFVPSTLEGQELQLPAVPRRSEPRFGVVPLKNARSRLPEIMRQASAGNTIPLWNYSAVSYIDGKTYSGQMVGRSPFYHGLRATTIQSYLVPVILTFPDGTVFNPTQTDPCLGSIVKLVIASSPIFQSVDFTLNGVDVGNTQYVDGFQRANFWNDISAASNGYHTLFGTTFLPAVNVTVPSGSGLTGSHFGCKYGYMDLSWWDSYVQNTLVPSLAAKGVGPTTLPIFYLDSVEMCDSFPSGCGYLGYHGAYYPSNLLQTYIVSDFDTSGKYGGDISVLSHEAAEWMDDPTGTNPTPAWGHVGQVKNCQANLEVGDPLSETFLPAVPLNGFTYHLQELAFFSWFFRIPSIGAGGVFSDNGTFTGDAGPVCM